VERRKVVGSQSKNIIAVIKVAYFVRSGTAVAQWLRCCATNGKVAVSIVDGVIGIFY